jgi:hypothetical protein
VNLCGYKDSTIKYSGMMEEMPTRLFSSLWFSFFFFFFSFLGGGSLSPSAFFGQL